MIFPTRYNTASIYKGGDSDLNIAYSHAPRVVGVLAARKHRKKNVQPRCVLPSSNISARMHVFIPTKRWNAQWRHKNRIVCLSNLLCVGVEF